MLFVLIAAGKDFQSLIAAMVNNLFLEVVLVLLVIILYGFARVFFSLIEKSLSIAAT